jgi:hypothetical protein
LLLVILERAFTAATKCIVEVKISDYTLILKNALYRIRSSILLPFCPSVRSRSPFQDYVSPKVKFYDYTHTNYSESHLKPKIHLKTADFRILSHLVKRLWISSVSQRFKYLFCYFVQSTEFPVFCVLFALFSSSSKLYVMKIVSNFIYLFIFITFCKSQCLSHNMLISCSLQIRTHKHDINMMHNNGSDSAFPQPLAAQCQA